MAGVIPSAIGHRQSLRNLRRIKSEDQLVLGLVLGDDRFCCVSQAATAFLGRFMTIESEIVPCPEASCSHLKKTYLVPSGPAVMFVASCARAVAPSSSQSVPDGEP